MMAKMEAFVSTLVPTVASLLGILLAAITAYFVFQRERTADFSKERFDEILTIRDHLLPLRKTPFAIEMFTPVEFMEKRRFDHRTEPRADLLKPLASAIDTHLPFSLKIEDEFRKLGDKYVDLPWRGRAYYLLLKEAAYQMAPQFEPSRPEQGTFPTRAIEIGFKEWCDVFNKIDAATRDTVGSSGRAIQAFRCFESKRAARPRLPNAEHLFLSWVH